MLKLLSYAVEFPTTGRSFSNRIEFAPGLTAITGPNEVGKTIILEMVGYALFGKSALRGAASDYRNLNASLTLSVRDQEVTVARAPRRETLTVDGKETAVGAEAINKAIPAMLGFGLDVYNIACAAQQGDLGALTEMRPTARRQMVDQLVGLDRLEEVERDCRQEARAASTLAASLANSVAAPEEPVAPDAYRPSAEIDAEIEALEQAQREREAWLRVSEPEQPAAPEKPAETDVEALKDHEDRRQVQLQARARIEGQLESIPRLTVTPEDLEKAVLYRDYKAEVARRGPQPEYLDDHLTHLEAILDAQDAAGEEATCPKCDHTFHSGLTPAQEALAALTSPLTRREIRDQWNRIEAWVEPLVEVREFEIDDLDTQCRAWESRALRQELEDGLATPVLEDKSETLAVARAFDTAFSIYLERMRTYDQKLAAWSEAQRMLNSFPDQSEGLGGLRVVATQARDYERQLERYNDDLDRYEAVMKSAAEAQVSGQGYEAGSRALAATRVAVKAELAPSLSLAASSLLASMTAGARRSIVVDEDFNVSVDGQPLATLSGSGKSVVNLALRIGMGQVLTSRVLPIFLGDEINADMDADRAGATHETMKALREYLTQIILVTHREIEADQTIVL